MITVQLKGRQFIDETGSNWTVFRVGGMCTVLPKPPSGIRLIEVPRSCARVAGAAVAPDGTPLAHVNEHNRIWGAIWNKGKEIEIDIDEDKLKEQG